MQLTARDIFHYYLDNHQAIQTPHYIQITIIKLPYIYHTNNKRNRHKTRKNNVSKSTKFKIQSV